MCQNVLGLENFMYQQGLVLVDLMVEDLHVRKISVYPKYSLIQNYEWPEFLRPIKFVLKLSLN